MRKTHHTYTPSVSIAIIGGGVIGLMLARQLNKEGYDVVVLEKGITAAAEASRAGGGIISPLHPWRYSQAMLDLAQWSHDHYREIAKELSLSTGIYVPVNKTGMLIPNVDEAEAALQCSFLTAQRINAQQVAMIEPGLSDPKNSVWVPEVHNIRNPALCRALVKDMQLRDIEILTCFDIQSVKKTSNKFTFLSKDKRKIETEKAVICAGAWSGNVLEMFVQQLGLDALSANLPEIFPVKGQMIALQTRAGTLRSVLLEGHSYLIPRHDGIVLVGSTVENADFDKQTTEKALKKLLSFAHSHVPATRYCRVVSQWAGLRPGSHRDSPIISSINELSGLYISVGHFRNGLLSAPASAQLAADLMADRKSNFNKQMYSL